MNLWKGSYLLWYSRFFPQPVKGVLHPTPTAAYRNGNCSDRAAKPPLLRSRDRTSPCDTEHTPPVNIARRSVTWVPAIWACWNYDEGVVLTRWSRRFSLPGESDPLFRPAHNGATFLSGSQAFPHWRQANHRPHLPVFCAGKHGAVSVPPHSCLATKSTHRRRTSQPCVMGVTAPRARILA